MNSTQPIDRPFTEEVEKKPESSTGLMIELALAVILAAGVLVRDVLGFPRTVVFPMFVALLLGAIYLFANWWINKPATTSFRTVAITILYGFVRLRIQIHVLARGTGDDDSGFRTHDHYRFSGPYYFDQKKDGRQQKDNLEIRPPFNRDSTLCTN